MTKTRATKKSSLYLFHRQATQDSVWQLAHCGEREALTRGATPAAFVTALDVGNLPVTGDAATANDWAAAVYAGPFYADFDDAANPELVCEKFKEFLAKLEKDYQFDLNQASLYATGSKGFHIEIPAACFDNDDAAQLKGRVGLPRAYKEMALALYVDTLDLSVYSAKRGRMWRSPNVQRDNGTYKVPLTVAEAKSVTPAAYAQLVQAPRPFPYQAAPVLNAPLAALFDGAVALAKKAAQGAAKRKDESQYLRMWKEIGVIPPSIAGLMDGSLVREGAEFQKLATQLAICAIELGLTESEFLAMCEGLVSSHESNSRRYRSRQARLSELRRMYQYMLGNNDYGFSAGALVNLLVEDHDTADLECGPLPEDVEPKEAEDEDEDGEETAAAVSARIQAAKPEAEAKPKPKAKAKTQTNSGAHKDLRRGFYMNGRGMFRRTMEGNTSLSRITFSKVQKLHDLDNEEFIGYEADMDDDGQHKGRRNLPHELFASAVNIRKWALGQASTFMGGDTDAVALGDVMNELAAQDPDGAVYISRRQGLMLVPDHRPGHKGERVKVYLSKDACLPYLRKGETYQIKWAADKNDDTEANLLDAGPVESHMRVAYDDLLTFNRPTTVADTVGWYSAAHARAYYVGLFDQFPLLNLVGGKGSGKTQTCRRLNFLHRTTEPDGGTVRSIIGMTEYTLNMALNGTTSIPVVLDEFKEVDLNKKGVLNTIENVLRLSYGGAVIGERGTGQYNGTQGSTKATIKYVGAAPVAFLSETLRDQAALDDRCIVVDMARYANADKRHTKVKFERMAQPFHQGAFSALGKELVMYTLRQDLEDFRWQLSALDEEVTQNTEDYGIERFGFVSDGLSTPRRNFNHAVVAHGLLMLMDVLSKHFGDRYTGCLLWMISSRLGSKVEDAAPSPGEPATPLLLAQHKVRMLTVPMLRAKAESEMARDEEREAKEQAYQDAQQAVDAARAELGTLQAHTEVKRPDYFEDLVERSRGVGLSEDLKVLNIMALLSRSDDDQTRLMIGRDYIINNNTMELRVETAFNCYLRHLRSLGQSGHAFFKNPAVWHRAVRDKQFVLDTTCKNSALRDAGSVEIIHKYDLELMSQSDVGSFAS